MTKEGARTEPAARPGPAFPADAADLAGRMLGDFHLLRRLGEGGMGQVYLAEQVSLKRRVALKLLKHELAANEVSRRRFVAEAEAVAKLTHANIVQVYAVGEESGQHYMALEYVDGRNLREYLARKGPPPLPVALSIMRQVAAALVRATELGIIHRDIKPENILVTRKAEVKVADFGLSRVVAEGQPTLNLTQTGVTMGTPLYMSPEQVEGRPLDHRTDIYSFGVTCYHLLAGHPPFEGENAFAVALQHVQREPPALASIRPDLPAALCHVVARMMAKDPEDRYQTAREVLKELKTLGDGSVAAEPLGMAETADTAAKPQAATVTAFPPLAPTRALVAPRSRRRWLFAGAVAGSLVLALAGGGLAGRAMRPPDDDAASSAENAEPAAGSPAFDALLGTFQQKERALLDLIQITEQPGKNPEELQKGVQYRIDLGLLYLEPERRDLKKAEAFFAKQSDNKIEEYKFIGKMGAAIVLAFKDDPKASNDVFLEIRGQAPRLQVPRLPNPRWVKMIVDALYRNRVNAKAKEIPYPEDLVRFEQALTRSPVRPAITPPAGNSDRSK